MEIETKVDFGQYKFRDENSVGNFFDGLSGIKEIKPPLVKKQLLSNLMPLWGKRSYFILQVAEFLGIENDTNRSILEWHDKRLRNFRSTAGWVSVLLILGLPIIIILASGFTNNDQILNYIFSSFFLMLLLLILFGNRISILIIKKYYADTICLMNGLSLMVELSHPDGISTPTNRRRIQTRMEYLANSMILLAQKYASASSHIDQRIHAHFHAMEEYIRDRETWVVLSNKDTLNQLRKDFAELLPFLITGNYGEFEVPSEEKKQNEEIPYWRRVASGILGMLGIVVPVITLVAHFGFKSFPAQGTEAEANTLVIMMVAWLLLTLDGILKLGLIETFTNIVKSVRELR